MSFDTNKNNNPILFYSQCAGTLDKLTVSHVSAVSFSCTHLPLSADPPCRASRGSSHAADSTWTPLLWACVFVAMSFTMWASQSEAFSSSDNNIYRSHRMWGDKWQMPAMKLQSESRAMGGSPLGLQQFLWISGVCCCCPMSSQGCVWRVCLLAQVHNILPLCSFVSGVWWEIKMELFFFAVQ